MVGSAAIKQGPSANRKHTYFFFGLGQKKKYVCLLFDENFKQGRSVDFLFYFFFLFFYLIFI